MQFHTVAVLCTLCCLPTSAYRDATSFSLSANGEAKSERAPMKITIAGFPENHEHFGKNSRGEWVSRNALNGDYFQCDTEIQGRPTYWKKEGDGAGAIPFIYYCAKNQSKGLYHNKWSIFARSSDESWEQAHGQGVCKTYAPFPPKGELAAGLKVDMMYAGNVKGWLNTAALNEAGLNIRIEAFEPIQETDSWDSASCSVAQEGSIDEHTGSEDDSGAGDIDSSEDPLESTDDEDIDEPSGYPVALEDESSDIDGSQDSLEDTDFENTDGNKDDSGAWNIDSSKDTLEDSDGEEPASVATAEGE